jgi:hypothetical protein
MYTNNNILMGNNLAFQVQISMYTQQYVRGT